METPKFTNKQIAAWRRIAMNVNSDVIKRDKIKSKINELQAEYDTLTASIDLYEAPVKLATNGYTTSDIFEKIVTNTGKVDKNGNAVKTTEYRLKYPETIIPVEVCGNTCDECVEVEEKSPVEELNNEANQSFII